MWKPPPSSTPKYKDNMKVILSINAIKPPLTGIGRYTSELATGLMNSPEVSHLRFLREGRWAPLPNLVEPVNSAKTALRKRLLRSSLAVGAYNLIAPQLLKQKLRGFADHVYHGPNFYLPPFDGISIATIHDLSIYLFPQHHPQERVSFMQRQIDITMARAHFLITDSEHTRQEVIKIFKWPEDRIYSVHLGVAKEFHPRQEPELRGLLAKHNLVFNQFTLCVSTIEPRKNLDTLLRAYKLLPDQIKLRCPLVLVGGKGWDSLPTYTMINEGASSGWLRYLGYVSEDELPLLYAAARGFAYPSIYEGFGLPIAEAMASGLPILVSNSSCLPEVASEAGSCIDPQDELRWKDALERMITDDAWSASERLKSLVVAIQYDWKNTVLKTVEIYKKCS